MWQIPMKNPKVFCKGYPLWFWDSWNRALWLAEKTSHDYFWALSLVEEIAWIFLQLVRRVGVCQIWVGFVNIGTFPIIGKTQVGFVISFIRKLFATLPEWYIGKSSFHSGRVANNPSMTNPSICQYGDTPHMWQIPMKNPKIFCKGYPLWFWDSWNWALWLVEKTSHDQFPGLSLAESIACNFPYPLGE